MNERFTISVTVPSLGSSYEFSVPSDMTIGVGIKLINQILQSSFASFNTNDDAKLVIDNYIKRPLHPNGTFEASGVKSGSKLILI